MSECLLICFVFNIVLLFKVKGQYLEQQQNRRITCHDDWARMSWDKEVANKFRALGFNQEQIGIVIGEIAEHKQYADRQGYERGFESGYYHAMDNLTCPEKRSNRLVNLLSAKGNAMKCSGVVSTGVIIP